ncbi:Thymidylate kinase [Apilactobacillus kunkeei]|uniref:Thymidylate kinase n=1 Tax=Apilactobacillus kunkeei DSM 12361 = ATCC 700308 TaxID=1423768 RepID=A0A0R1G271_9LACO|nr:dTMP kinase [Apilactobacillus kunkeei]KOY73504.1 Thymidylate kinase [Apilactobacillus kunkeei DSM 12361 = ATCC 700308]KRK25095.1 thymidylate kinase [Apilactobacillus kunkeei DSM 12361 = ATCC 700308]MCK8620610.1 dTMP kinase [Apilactobacillus kunkeei]MCK8628923.1 dTMP kinase [Apilactobacillus kunkeei]QYU53417.1 dTMP kinase [Apilactobacillus kunkeei]
MAGKFITFEGTDGAGKTTILNMVLDYLKEEMGDKLVTSREPGGNPIAESIREVILDRKNVDMDKRTEALLYAAARRQNIEQTVKPAIADNKLVICDRYLDSSIAYQGGGREIGEDAINEMNQFATEGFLPDLTIYFNLPVEEGLKRIAKNRAEDEVDRLDVETIDFHNRVHAAYQRLAKANPERIKSVDATQSIEAVYQNVLEILQPYLNELKK